MAASVDKNSTQYLIYVTVTKLKRDVMSKETSKHQNEFKSRNYFWNARYLELYGA